MCSQDETRWQDYAVEAAVHAALEAERQRLAQQLEDVLISQINLVLAQIQSYEQTSAGQSRMALPVLSSLVRQLLQQAYDLQAELKPSTLETLGLEPALETLANQQRRSTGISITLALPYHRQRLPAHIELALFRSTQAIIHLVTTQGSATRVDIRLEHEDSGVQYSLTTNDTSLKSSLLQSTRQRIEWLGGQVRLVNDQPRQMTIRILFATGAPVELTEREMAVIRLVAEGLTNAEIAAQLAIRPRTVKFHLDNIYSKLEVNSRTAAAIHALRQGWVQRQPPA